MAYENLLVGQEENVGIITLNRPPANPINFSVLSELDDVLTKWEKDKALRAIIITGAGERGFSAGFDLKTAGTPDGEKAMARGQQVFSRIEKYPKPVIAAINGFALGMPRAGANTVPERGEAIRGPRAVTARERLLRGGPPRPPR